MGIFFLLTREKYYTAKGLVPFKMPVAPTGVKSLEDVLMFQVHDDTKHSKPLISALFTGICGNNNGLWLQNKSSKHACRKRRTLTFYPVACFKARDAGSTAATLWAPEALQIQLSCPQKSAGKAEGWQRSNLFWRNDPFTNKWFPFAMPPADIPGHIHIYQHWNKKWIPTETQCIWPEHYYQYASCLRVIVGANKDSAIFTCGKRVAGIY